MPGTEVVVSDDGYTTGLEDFDTADMATPRLVINHKTTKLVNSLSKEEYDSITVIGLGLVKQRVLWAPEVEDDAHPLCKSYDYALGHPDDDFPWGASGFNESDFANVDVPMLSCESCKLKEWDSHPSRSIPWCTEQYVIPVLMSLDDGGAAPAIVTFQRSQLKNTKDYISSFVQSKQPMFVAYTEITLSGHTRGSVDYATPNFKRLGLTDVESHQDFIDAFLSIRRFLVTPRVRNNDSDTTTTSTPVDPPKMKDAKADSAGKEAAPVASTDDDDEDIPF